MAQTYYDSEITVEGEKITVPFVPVSELLQFNEPPYVFVGSSGSGKTVFSVDVLHQFAKKANYIYYVSQTKPSFDPNNPIRQIPNLFLRNPEKNTFQTIKDIWDDITQRCDSMKMSPDEMEVVLTKLYGQKGITKLITNSVANLGKTEAVAAQLEIITRMVIDRCKHEPKSMDKLTDAEKAKVNSMISHSTRSILILDDLSTLINQAQNAKQTTTVNSNAVNAGKAFQDLLNDIFTRGRHYNCICCCFIHSLKSTLRAEILNNILNFVITDKVALREIKASSSFGLGNLLTSVSNQIGIFDEKKYSYYVVYVRRASTIVKITKAQLHQTPIELNEFVEEYNEFLNGMLVSRNQEQPKEKETLLFDGQIDIDDI